jgi:hypothetical protein
MHMTRGWTRFRTAVIALGLLASGAPRVVADDIMTYSTSGAVGTSGVSGSGNVISFVPVQNASVDTASNISLGYFQVAGLSAGQSTTYDNTPVTMTVVPSAFGPMTSTSSASGTASPQAVVAPTPLNDTPITVTGFLNGTVSGPFQSSVQITFNPISNPTFSVPNGTGTLNLLANDQQLLVPSSVNNGQTTLQAQITTTIGHENGVPEPSTIALFLSTVGGLGLRRLVHSRRRRAAA